MAFKLIRAEWRSGIGGVKEFVLDEEKDVAALPKCVPGSAALVVATGNVYIVNASGEWVAFGSEG